MNKGIKVILPQVSNWVAIRVSLRDEESLILQAFDQYGSLLGEIKSPSDPEVQHSLYVRQKEIKEIILRGGNNEGFLIDVSCGF